MFLVVEEQMWADGSYHYITYNYADRMEAEAKYHYILSEAALAKIPLNGACVLDNKLNVLMAYVYQHGEYLVTENEES